MLIPVLCEDVMWLIIQQCARDPRPLFGLLLLNKQYMRLVVPILYHSPRINLDPPFSRPKLEYLLAGSSGYLLDMYGEGHMLPPWPNPVQFPTSIPYASFVQQDLGNDMYLDRWALSCIDTHDLTGQRRLPNDPYGYISKARKWYTDEADHKRHQAIFHIRHFGRTITSLDIPAWTLALMVELVQFLPRLERVRIMDNLRQQHAPREAELIVKFVQSHVELFPGVLRKPNLVCQSSNWELFLELQRIVGRVSKITELSLMLDQEVDFSPLPTQHVETLEYWSSDQEICPAELLKQCRVMNTLKLRNGRAGTFAWARQEREALEMGQQKDQWQDMSLGGSYRGISAEESSTLLQPSPPSLVPLKHLEHLGHNNTEVLVDAFIGFQSTLEIINISTNAVRVNSKVLSWSVKLPQLKSLTVEIQEVDISNLAETAPNLKHLKIRDWTLWRGEAPRLTIIHSLPSLLTTLNLSGRYFDRMSIEVLKPLVHLQELVLIGTTSKYDNVQHFVSMESLSDWSFPRLKKLELAGPFASFLQGAFLAVAPALQVLRLRGSLHSKVHLRMHLFDIPEKSATIPGFEHLDFTSDVSHAFHQRRPTHSSLTNLSLENVALPFEARVSGTDVERLVAGPDQGGIFPNLRFLELGNIECEPYKQYSLLEQGMRHPRLKLFVIGGGVDLSVTSLDYLYCHIGGGDDSIDVERALGPRRPGSKGGTALLSCGGQYYVWKDEVVGENLPFGAIYRQR